jgi:RNA polymerase sigma-70 factor (ECF subfamily)
MASILLPREASQTMKVNTPSEQALLKGALRFDKATLAKIYDLYSPELYRYAVRFLGDPSLAEDCVADTFSRFLKALSSGRGPQDHLRAYLYRIAHNLIVDYYRRAPDIVELKETHPGTDNTPEQEANLRMRQAQMRKAIQQLTPDQQKVIAFKYLQGWKNEEIAQTLNKPVGAIKSLQHRALASLQRILSKEKSL